MADEPINLVLEHLRRIDRKADTVIEEVRGLSLRIGAVERVLSGHAVSEFQQNEALDRLKARVDRIERRLELNEG
jgi:hypothetical protein